MIGARTMQVRQFLGPWIEAGIFGSLEIHAAERIAGAGGRAISRFDALSVASAVWATQQGHVCFDLDDVATWTASVDPPDVRAWTDSLASSELVHLAGTWNDEPDPSRPLVVFDRRIYLARQWSDEKQVAELLRRRLDIAVRTPRSDVVGPLFSLVEHGGPQYHGVMRSVEARTSLLTGGPGTGKTYTIARILVAAVQLGVESIALVAPTAKAAVQMRDSLTAALSGNVPGLDEGQRHLLERLEPSTIHRLLGSRSGTSTRFRHDSKHRLGHDLIVVDEMSMVSLPLMARFLEAVDPSTTLVLVGDPGQLDSVENGSILRDLTGLDLAPNIPTTVLHASRRNVGTRSSAFADAVRSGDAERVREILHSPDSDGTLLWVETSEPLSGLGALSEIVTGWKSLGERATKGEIDSVLSEVNDARVLCPHRDGPHGVAVWNEELAHMISESRDRWRIGDVVVKTRNDLGQGLANGDVGVVARVDGALVFVFRHGDSAVHVPVAVDDSVQLAFATTVHKAQGSEFATVAVVVPPAASPSSTRELLYTAMTRAKPRAILIGTEEDILHSVSTQRRRWSGLGERLRMA